MKIAWRALGGVFFLGLGALVLFPRLSLSNRGNRAPGGAVQAKVQLEWDAGAGSETDQFVIEQSADGVHFVQIQVAPAKLHSAIVDGLARGQTYYFRIRALNRSGQSGYSEVLRVGIPFAT